MLMRYVVVSTGEGYYLTHEKARKDFSYALAVSFEEKQAETLRSYEVTGAMVL